MKKNNKVFASILAITMTVLTMGSCASFGNNSGQNSTAEPEGPWEYILEEVQDVKNVILLIGDGMGPEHIRAGEIYKGKKLEMQKFPYKVKVNTDSLDGTTDSSAASTAMATGTLINNGMVGIKSDWTTGEDHELTTIVDIAAGMGKRTGILSTEPIYGATPMGFSAHNISRSSSGELVESAAKTSNVNLFACSTMSSSFHKTFTTNGYQQIADIKSISEAEENKIFGAYNIMARAASMTADGMIAFDYLVTEALEYLSKDEDGFFLMAEGAHIDHGAHENNMQYMLEELLAFDDAVKAACAWAKNRDDTVVIVTADHETGCLMLGSSITKENMFDVKYDKPENYLWASSGHTSTEVWCFVNGFDIDFSKYSLGEENTIKNTDIFEIVKDLFEGNKR